MSSTSSYLKQDAGRHSSILFIFFNLLAFFSNITTAEQGAVIDASDISAYDNGEYGSVPTEILRSVDYNVTRMARRTWNEQCNRPDEYYFFNTYGVPAPPHSGPQILDTNGSTVWFGDAYRGAWNVAPVTYKNEQYLSFWQGDPNVRGRGHGEGSFILLDKHYQPFTTIEAVGDVPADMHEFSITADDTALVIVCKPMFRNDLNKLGVLDSNGYIADCTFQELDISTSPATLLFSWRASDHVSLYEAWKRPDPSVSYNTSATAIDWFHLNSVTKDKHGNYLISSRHTSTIFYISGSDGHIIWRLGGPRSSFTDPDGHDQEPFFRQHHARWHDANDSSILTLFDNGPETYDRPSRGLKLRLDQENMTVALETAFQHPLGYWSESQGSVQELSDGHWLVGWGNVGALSEWDAEGKEMLCDWQFSALHDKYNVYNGTFSPGAVWSYRTTRSPWVGLPLTAPAVLLEEKSEEVVQTRVKINESNIPVCSELITSHCWEPILENSWHVGDGKYDDDYDEGAEDIEYGYPEADSKVLFAPSSLSTTTSTRSGDATLYLSWNGATEVRTWEVWSVDGMNLNAPQTAWSWVEVAKSEKEGFETAITIPAAAADWAIDAIFKIEARDASDGVLGTWLYRRGEASSEPHAISTQLSLLSTLSSAASSSSDSTFLTSQRLKETLLFLDFTSFDRAYALFTTGVVLVCIAGAATFFRRRMRKGYVMLAQSPIMRETRRHSE